MRIQSEFLSQVPCSICQELERNRLRVLAVGGWLRSWNSPDRSLLILFRIIDMRVTQPGPITPAIYKMKRFPSTQSFAEDEFSIHYQTMAVRLTTSEPLLPGAMLDSVAQAPHYIARVLLGKHYSLALRMPCRSKRVLIPENDSKFATDTATGRGSIGAQVELCKSTWGGGQMW